MFSGMFGPSKRTLNKRDAETLAQYQQDKEEREQTQKSAYQSEQQMEDMFKDMNGQRPGTLGAKRGTAERSKFIFKDDESDDDLARQDEDDEDQINEGIDDLTDIVGRLKGAAIGMGGNLTTQNERLDRLAGKVSSLTTNLDHLVASINMRSQTDAVDDRVSQPWDAKFSASTSYLGPSYLTPCTEALWLPNTAAALRTLLPRYRVVHPSLTRNCTGPDEPREVEPHPLNTANTSHQRVLACTSQSLYLGPRRVVHCGSDGPRNPFGVYVYIIVEVLMTVLKCTRMCVGKCMHGRSNDVSRLSNKNVSLLTILSNPRRELIFRTSCLTMIMCRESPRGLRGYKRSSFVQYRPWGLVHGLRVS